MLWGDRRCDRVPIRGSRDCHCLRNDHSRLGARRGFCSGDQVDNSDTDQREGLTSALNYLRLALQRLDEGSAPAHIGAHVDLAIHQLEDALSGELQGRRSSELD